MCYRTNPNVVCTEMFGRYFLVAARSEWDSIPYVQEINEQAAVCWEILESKKSFKEMTDLLCEKYSISKKEASIRLEMFLNELAEKGYISEETSDV